MMLSNTTFRALALCAGLPGNPAVKERLRSEAAGLPSWDDLAQAAEDHGLEPLVLAHFRNAGIAIPADIGDRLRARWMQHAHAHAVRTRVVCELARVFAAASIPFLLLKGAALAHLVYDKPLLRPMRDVDVLVRKRDVRRAHAVLQGGGFTPEGPAVAPDYHHLQAMSTTVEGATVTIELHHELLRATAFLKPICYENVRGDAQPFEWAGTQFHTLGREDMLWHVYAHAFAINVLRPAVRLISVADLVSLVEAWVDRLDWDRVGREFGRVLRALPLFHHLTPWSPRVLEVLGGGSRRSGGVRPIASSVVWSGALNRDVLWPPEWWFRVRYGIDGPRRWSWYRVIGHPARLVLAAGQTATTRMAKRVCINREHLLLTETDALTDRVAYLPRVDDRRSGCR
jgi:hypothetical protein